MRVFISSTVYDLIDIRAELAEQLRAIGITPVLSDDKLSDFRVQHDVNSIETCLVNVDSCDEFLLILDQRYGPTLEKCGYDKISATHLEYQRAIEKKIPIRVYVRDRLDADFAIWKRNGRTTSSVKLSWVTEKKGMGLFELLDEHGKLQACSTASNWYSTFTSSIDLKAAITKHFEKRILPERLVEAIQNNVFPLFDIKLENIKVSDGNGVEIAGTNALYKTKASLTNISGVPAFNCYIYWEDVGKELLKRSDIFSPGRSALMTHFWGADSSPKGERIIIVEYDSLIGISVYNRFCVSICFGSNGAVFNSRLVDRKFQRSAGVSLQIEDV